MVHTDPMTSLPSARIISADAASIPGSNDLIIYLTSHHPDGINPPRTLHTEAVISRREAERLMGRLMDPDPIEDD